MSAAATWDEMLRVTGLQGCTKAPASDLWCQAECGAHRHAYRMVECGRCPCYTAASFTSHKPAPSRTDTCQYRRIPHTIQHNPATHRPASNFTLWQPVQTDVSEDLRGIVCLKVSAGLYWRTRYNPVLPCTMWPHVQACSTSDCTTLHRVFCTVLHTPQRRDATTLRLP